MSGINGVATMIACFLALTSTVGASTPILCQGIWAPNTSEAKLRQHFGSARVRQQKIGVGEGDYQDGTVVNSTAGALTVMVLWKDSIHRRSPSTIYIRQTSRQTTYGNIGLGTTLKRLEQLNGRSFQLAGFNFDYSGTVTSWSGGRMEHIGDPGCEIKPRLLPRFSRPLNAAESAAAEATVGDRDFMSSDPNMQVLNPRVYEILLVYR